MFRVQVDKTTPRVIETESVTSGSSNVYDMEFVFSPDWDGFEKTVIFLLNPGTDGSSQASFDVILDESNRCKLPWELFEEPDNEIYFGVFGIKDTHTILPTTAVSLTTVIRGVLRSDTAPSDPSPDVYQQILAKVSEIYEAIASGMLKGEKGDRGIKGEKGDRGERGFTGDKGPKGDQGVPGPQGEKGIQGETGDSGVYIGTEEPTDPDINVWINPSGTADADISFGVTSFNARNGDVLPQKGDYTAVDVGAVPETRTINSHELSSDVTLTAEDVNAVPTTRTINTKPLSSDISLTAEDIGARPNDWVPTMEEIGIDPSDLAPTPEAIGAVPDTRTINGKPLSSDITLTAEDIGVNFDGLVPNTRTVNGQALSSDITLNAANVGARSDTWLPTASEIGAVPTSRTVNGKALSSDISLTASDVSARPSNWTPTASDVGALPIAGGTLTGNLRIKGSGNYGTMINLGDSDYVHFSEPTDDCLEIKAKKINFVVSDTTDAKFTLNGAAIGGGSGHTLINSPYLSAKGFGSATVKRFKMYLITVENGPASVFYIDRMVLNKDYGLMGDLSSLSSYITVKKTSNSELQFFNAYPTDYTIDIFELDAI